MSKSSVERPGISVVIPVYQGAATIDELVVRLIDALRSLGIEHEIVLVNDGSTDDSWKHIEVLAAEHAAVHGIDLFRNFGQHNALLAGVRSARHEIVVTMDDDLQNPPEEIGRLLNALTDDVDVVYGAPERKNQPIFRRWASFLTRVTLSRVMGVAAGRNVSSLRAFRTHLRDAFEEFMLPEFSLDVLLSWGTQRFAVVTVRHDSRRDGQSNYSIRSLLRHMVNMVIGFSAAPLRIASVLGFFSVGVGIAILLYVLIKYLVVGASVPGFAFIAASVATFAGVQLFVLGMIGEYLAKMFQRSMGKPPYTVRTTTQDRTP